MHEKLHPDEWAYPFLPDTDSRCDWELATDTLASQIAHARSLLGDREADLRPVLDRMAELAYHLNGSVRGRLGVDAGDLAWLHGMLEDLRQQFPLPAGLSFVLPGGSSAATALHMARCTAKTAVRILYRVEREGHEVPDLLYRTAGILANLLWACGIATNALAGVEERPFISRSY